MLDHSSTHSCEFSVSGYYIILALTKHLFSILLTLKQLCLSGKKSLDSIENSKNEISGKKILFDLLQDFRIIFNLSQCESNSVKYKLFL